MTFHYGEGYLRRPINGQRVLLIGFANEGDAQGTPEQATYNHGRWCFDDGEEIEAKLGDEYRIISPTIRIKPHHTSRSVIYSRLSLPGRDFARLGEIAENRFYPNPGIGYITFDEVQEILRAIEEIGFTQEA